MVSGVCASGDNNVQRWSECWSAVVSSGQLQYPNDNLLRCVLLRSTMSRGVQWSVAARIHTVVSSFHDNDSVLESEVTMTVSH